MASSEWNNVCDYNTTDDQNTANRLCHCGPNAESEYRGTYCDIIEQTPYEKVLSFLLFAYGLLVVGICTYWLITYWRSDAFDLERQKIDYLKIGVDAREKFTFATMVSYALILEQGIAAIYLYMAEQAYPPRDDQWDGVNYWTQFDGTPIYFSYAADLALHFLRWFCFWMFLHVKLIKFCVSSKTTHACTCAQIARYMVSARG